MHFRVEIGVFDECGHNRNSCTIVNGVSLERAPRGRTVMGHADINRRTGF
jgi:hypothetical protein